jgi:hypothetical protein
MYHHHLPPPFQTRPTNAPSHCEKFRNLDTYQQRACVPITHTIFAARISAPISYRHPHFPSILNNNNKKGFLGWLKDAHIGAIYNDNEAAIRTATIFPAFDNNFEEIRR